MGVDFYLVSDETQELYALGRGAWYNCSKQPTRDKLIETAEGIAIDFGADIGEARRWARELEQWFEKHEGKVRIVSDADDAFDELRDYTTTGNVTDRRKMSHEDIQQRVKQVADDLRDELGADSVDLVVTIEKTYMIDDPDENHLFEYIGISGYDRQLSGFRLIRVKN